MDPNELRKLARYAWTSEASDALRQAADEIEKLRADAERLHADWLEETSAHYRARNEAIDLTKEVERLRVELTRMTDAASLLSGRVERAEAMVERLREACEERCAKNRAEAEGEKLRAVANWARAAVDLYGHSSDYQDPMHRLAVALRALDSGSKEEK